MFPVENKRRIQPKAYVAVQSTGIARGLALAVNLQNGIVRNAVNGEVAVLTGTAATPASTCGLHGKLFASASYAFTKSSAPLPADNFTILVIQNFKGVAANYQTAVSFNADFSLYLPHQTTGGIGYDTLAGSSVALSATGVIKTGKTQTIVVTKNATTVKSFIDGVAQSSGATPTGWTAPVTTRIGTGQGTEYCQSELDLVLIWKRELSPQEVSEISKNPWQVFEPYKTFIPVLSSDTPVTHDISGLLSSDNSSIVSNSAHLATHTDTGSLSSNQATVSATASRFRSHDTTSALSPQGSSLVGATTRFRALSTTCTLVSTPSIVAGIIARFRAMQTSGALSTQGSSVSATVARFRSHDINAVLTGQPSTVDATASHTTSAVTHDTTSELAGQPSTVSATVSRFRSHATTSVLSPQGSSLVGAATRFRALSTTGTLVSKPSVVAGIIARFRAMQTSGTLLTQGSSVSATAIRFRAHDINAVLTGQLSTVSATASRFRSHATTSALSPQGSSVVGSTTRFRALSTTGTLVSKPSVIAGIFARFRAMQTSGALSTQGSSVSATATRFRAHDVTAVLTGQPSTVNATASHSAGNVTHDITGVLSGQSSTVNATASHNSSVITHGTTSIIAGQSSIVSASAIRFRALSTTGTLVSKPSVIAGIVDRYRAMQTSGALSAKGSSVSATVARFKAHDVTAVLTGQPSIVIASASHTASPVTHNITGVLTGKKSTVSGTVSIIGVAVTHDISGGLSGSQASLHSTSARSIKEITAAHPAAITHVINWKSNSDALKPPLTIITDPESINTGDVIKISLYSAYPHDLISPYDGLGSKSVAPDSDNLPITEVIELSGSSDISTKFPISSASSMLAALPLVDEITRKIIVHAGMPLGALVRVVNNQLKIDDSLKLHGSIRVIYRTFNAQKWTHQPFLQKGNALLFSYNKTLATYEDVPLSINERSNTGNDSIKINYYPNPSTVFSYERYAYFIVFPASKNAIIKTDFGKAERQGEVSYLVEKERISFNGKEANAEFLIDNLSNFKGFFFDGKGKVIEPSFHVDGGILKSSVDCYGTGYLSYSTLGTVYAYSAEKTQKDVLGGGLEISVKIGSIFAFDPVKIGIAATYDIPVMSTEQVNPIEFCRIYSEYVVQEQQAFELPPNFPTDNIYPSQPTGNFPSIDETSLIIERTHIIGNYFSGGGIDTQSYVVNWLDPYTGNTDNPDLVYKVKENVPEDADEYTKQLMRDKIKELKVKYGIKS